MKSEFGMYGGGIAAVLFMAVALFLPVDEATKAVGNSGEPKASVSAFDRQMNQILHEQERTRQNEVKMTGTLDAIIDRLERMETALDEIRADKVAEIIEPPDEPEALVVPDESPPVVVQTTQPAGYATGLHILANYSGQGYYARGHRGDANYLRRHIVEHGHPSGGLSRFTYNELERIHGAYHTGHWSTRGHAPQVQATIPANSGTVRWSTGNTAGTVRYISGPRYRSGTVRVQNCPNGFCPLIRR